MSRDIVSVEAVPTLAVVIRNRFGEIVNTVELPDPRHRFADIYNACPFHREMGWRAEPSEEGGDA